MKFILVATVTICDERREHVNNGHVWRSASEQQKEEKSIFHPKFNQSWNSFWLHFFVHFTFWYGKECPSKAKRYNDYVYELQFPFVVGTKGEKCVRVIVLCSGGEFHLTSLFPCT